MKELLDKISSYNFFNNLLPGVLFSLLLNALTNYKVNLDSLVIGAAICYFFGLICSRVGSLLLGPLLLKINFVKFSTYLEFVEASNQDSKIELLSEVNNMYRTFFSMFVILAVVKLYEYLSQSYSFLVTFSPYISILALTLLFLYSFKKQTKYINDRIKITQKEIKRAHFPRESKT